MGHEKHIYNLVRILEDEMGQGLQIAIDTAGEMANKKLAKLKDLFVELEMYEKTLEPNTARNLQRYVEGIRNCIRANLWWSLRTKWYFGNDAKVVRKSDQRR